MQINRISCGYYRLYKLLQQRLDDLCGWKEEATLKTTDCSVDEYTETEQQRSKQLAKYSIQELEELIGSSGDGYLGSFSRFFHEYGHGILTQISSNISTRSKSQFGNNRHKINIEEADDVSVKYKSPLLKVQKPVQSSTLINKGSKCAKLSQYKL